ncbi:MAG TPA: hypothetical protein DIU20_04700 [Cryomorphaceae bacterium]|nr:hypothetical protein [Cryomorphaceae bacterium]
MENVTTGYWIFAGIFFIAFIAYLVWGYRKDLKLHKLHYGNAIYVMVAIIVILFSFYVFKKVF